MNRTGNRIPRDYFVTSGVGESDITVHAGSYHLALRAAGIEMANQLVYYDNVFCLVERPNYMLSQKTQVFLVFFSGQRRQRRTRSWSDRK